MIPEDHHAEENYVKCDDSDDDKETGDLQGLEDAVAIETLPIGS